MRRQPGINKKAPFGAFFVTVLWLCAQPVMAGCSLDRQLKPVESVKIAKVLDGDTVRLSDGRRIRFVGINTPEVAHPPRPEEPVAMEAKHELEALLRDTPIYLQVGNPAQDHYGRTLGHLFDGDGHNIIAELLKEGAGFQVAIPPNMAYVDCYAAAQAEARAHHLGVWGNPYFRPIPADSHRLRGGYAQVIGRVEKVALTKKFVWVDLQGDLTLKLARQDAEFLAGDTFDQVIAASRKRTSPTDLVLEARGWVVDRNAWGGRMVQQIKAGRRKPFQMKIQYAGNWELVPASRLQ